VNRATRIVTIPVIRTAFVLGAGLGTRLRPLTNRRPKPLIPVAGQLLIARAFDHLLPLGVERFVVNTHWCADRYQEFFPGGEWRGCPITFFHEAPEVMETAGGIWNARAGLGDGPFIVYNGDILSDIPLARAWDEHVRAGNEVTLVLRSRGENRNVLFDGANARILDLRRVLRPEVEPRHLFTGIYIVEPRFIARIPAQQKLSVVPIFHDMIREGAKLGGIVLDDGDWRDLGTRDEYLFAHAALGGGCPSFPGAELRDCIVWPGGDVAPGAKLTRCIITDGARAEGAHTDVDFEPPAFA
jgi:mannose-1-phosphate guanylyltransferase